MKMSAKIGILMAVMLLALNSYSTQSAKAEGFTEAKILSASFGRSALGITAGKELLLVTVLAATMAELAPGHSGVRKSGA